MHWGVGFWPLFPLVWIGIIAFLCWGVSRWSGWRGWHAPYYGHGGMAFEPEEMEILRRRYARGEIDASTFDQMRERLESTGRPGD